MPDQSFRDYYQRRLSDLKKDQSSFRPHWKEISENIQPRRGRFDNTDVNKGTKRHKAIINSAGTQALHTAQAGLFAGVMSPTRPWFDLATPDPGLMQFMPVKVWLKQVAQQMRGIFNAGNLYTMAPVMIGEVLMFATGCMTHVDDEENLARFYTHTAGSYYISQDDKFQVNTLAREYMMSAEQMALEFTDGKDLSKLSVAVRNALSTNQLGAMFSVVHFIEPNNDFRPHNPLSKFKPFVSVKYEPGHENKDMILSKKGFDDFPVYAPRWGVTGEDVYGTDCPGMTTLGDVKQLQIMEKRKAQAIDKQVNPPLSAPPSVRNTPITGLPGGLNVYDGGSGQKIESLYQVNLPLDHLTNDMDRVERRIDEAFFVDLFLAISNMEGIQPRNQLELSERNAERLLQLGPVLERMQGEFLDPLIARTFNQMVKAELVPEAPPEIQGSPLKVEYISSLAQAQRSVDTRGIDRLTEFIAGLKGAGMSDGKKFDGDRAIQKYSDLLGTPPELMVDDKVIVQQRQHEARQQAQAANLEAAEQAGRAAASAGQVDLEGDNLVSRAVNVGAQRAAQGQ